MKNILLTGGEGFVGRSLLQRLLLENTWNVCAVTRRKSPLFPPEVTVVKIDDLSGNVRWDEIIVDIDVVVHTAGRVHIMKDQHTDPLSEYRRVNVAGTLGLARHAAISGVKRFVFLSSIKVYGECSEKGAPFSENDNVNPIDPYSLSKYEAEAGLLALADEYDMEVVIIRPPLVYGPGVKANFLSLMKLLYYRIPLPLAKVNSLRSFVAIDNLVDFIVLCMTHRSAGNEIFLVSDGRDVSVPELMVILGEAMNKPARLFHFPVIGLKILALVLGQKKAMQRVLGTLQLDVQKAKKLLNWVPPVKLETSLKGAAGEFLRKHKN